MKDYHNPYIGVRFPLSGFSIAGEQDGWVVLQHDSGGNVSVRVVNHFFTSPEELQQYMQQEIEKLSAQGDLVQFQESRQLDDQSFVMSHFQYIQDVSHLVITGCRLLKNRPGFIMNVVTKDEGMIEYCQPLFEKAESDEPYRVGKADEKTMELLRDRNLRYMHAYTSNWGSGGGTSTEQSFSFFRDQSFKYQYSNMASFGSLGGSTSRDEGAGSWTIEKDKTGMLHLILLWHLGGTSDYELKNTEPGIFYLNNDKYFIAN